MRFIRQWSWTATAGGVSADDERDHKPDAHNRRHAARGHVRREVEAMRPDYHTVVKCDCEDCRWNRDGVCSCGQLELYEYKLRNKMGEMMAVVCERRRLMR